MSNRIFFSPCSRRQSRGARGGQTRVRVCHPEQSLRAQTLGQARALAARGRRGLRRGYYSQWDIDEYNGACIDHFDYLAQFVSMHYALSHRDDTPYWKDATSRSYVSEIKEMGKLQTQSLYHFSIWKKAFDWKLPQDGSGVMCLAAGMNWHPMDTIIMNGFNKELIEDHLWMQTAINNMNTRKEVWSKAVKNEPTLHDFLYYNYYKDQQRTITIPEPPL